MLQMSSLSSFKRPAVLGMSRSSTKEGAVCTVAWQKKVATGSITTVHPTLDNGASTNI